MTKLKISFIQRPLFSWFSKGTDDFFYHTRDQLLLLNRSQATKITRSLFFSLSFSPDLTHVCLGVVSKCTCEMATESHAAREQQRGQQRRLFRDDGVLQHWQFPERRSGRQHPRQQQYALDLHGGATRSSSSALWCVLSGLLLGSL